MILVMFVIRVATEGVFTATALFINNSVVFGKLGEVNGLAHSLTALLMCVCVCIEPRKLLIAECISGVHHAGPVAATCALTTSTRGGSLARDASGRVTLSEMCEATCILTIMCMCVHTYNVRMCRLRLVMSICYT